jgi:hypothetical protein
MTKKSAKKSTTGSTAQKAKFLKAARELGCDDSETAFDERLRRLAQKEKGPPKK